MQQAIAALNQIARGQSSSTTSIADVWQEEEKEVTRASAPTTRLPGHDFLSQFARALRTVPMGKPKGKKGKSVKKFKTAGRGSKFRPGDIKVGTVIDYGKMAWNGLKKIKALINVEEKMFDVSQVLTNAVWGGTTINLSNIAEGSDYNTRNGDSILVQRLSIKYQIASNTTPTQVTTTPVLRFVVVRDMLQNAGTDPTLANLIETAGTSAAHLQPLLHYHDGNAAARRFRILADVTHAIQYPYATTIATTGTGTLDTIGVNHLVGELDLKVNAHTTYQATSGTDAADWVGALYLIFWSNIQTAGPQLAFFSRLYFTDN